MKSREISLAGVIALATVVMCLTCVTLTSQAQTFHVIYSFTGGADGANPIASVAMDAAGNLYGTAAGGGNLNCHPPFGCGSVFRLARRGSGWILTPLHGFAGQDDGAFPNGVIIGPDGSLYGTTQQGGGGSCGSGGCGTIFKLTPPPTPCQGTSCGWTEGILYRFHDTSDGNNPQSGVVFDAAGNMYGTTFYGGAGAGIVYELTPTIHGWTKSTLYKFTGGSDGRNLSAGVILDGAGNIYGTASAGGGNGCDAGCGTVFELTQSGSGWAENTLYTFQNGSDGKDPAGGLTFDPYGNIYGSTFFGGSGNGGTVFELLRSNGSWTYMLLYGLPGVFAGAWGPSGSLTMDAAGNLYGTTVEGGMGCFSFGCGTVFKLMPSGGGWTYTSLYDFTNGADGGNPWGSVIFDAKGDLYGTASQSGIYQHGVIFEITP